MSNQPSPEADEQLEPEQWAEQIRRRFLGNRDFAEMVRSSQEDERAGRYVTHGDVLRNHGIVD
jgi:hypothetical protein